MIDEDGSKVASFLLFLLNRNEQTLEIAGSEPFVVPSLDHLEEQGGSVFDWLGKDLQEVSLFVVVNQDLVFLKDVDIL